MGPRPLPVLVRSGPISVLVVEDHPTVRESLAALIGATAGLSLWGTAASGPDALDQLGRTEAAAFPTIAVVDLSMPGMNGIELIGRMRVSWPDLACVVLSAHRAAVYSGRAQAAGARGYVEKGNLTALMSVLRHVGEGGNSLVPQA